MKTIQINQCTQEDLEWLPGVGAATAKKIIEARPIEAKTDLEQVVPPSAWLKIQEAGVEFEFGGGKPEEPTLEEVEAALEKALTPIQAPITLLQEPMPLTLRRVMPGQELKAGASYMCIWNVAWGPGGEAFLPADAPTQAEIGAWFQAHNMDIQFAHYGASVRVHTKNRGPVPLVLFEIIPEETQDATDSEGDERGD